MCMKMFFLRGFCWSVMDDTAASALRSCNATSGNTEPRSRQKRLVCTRLPVSDTQTPMGWETVEPLCAVTENDQRAACMSTRNNLWRSRHIKPVRCETDSRRLPLQLSAPLFIQKFLSEQQLRSRPLAVGTCDAESRDEVPAPQAC